ncbi:MAG: hypothetical protein AAF288_10045 [Planctomycetota bacterium]
MSHASILQRPVPPESGDAPPGDAAPETGVRLGFESRPVRSRDLDAQGQAKQEFVLWCVVVALLALVLQASAFWLGPLRDGARSVAAADARELALGRSIEEHGEMLAPPANAMEAELARLRYDRREISSNPDAGPIPATDRMPGGPAWLALIAKLGLPLWAASAAQAMLAVGVAVLGYVAAYGLTRRPGWSAAAGAAVAVQPAMLTAGLAPGGALWATALLLAALALVSFAKTMTAHTALGAGAAMGAASLVAPIGFGPGVLLGAGVALARRGQRGVAFGVIIAAVASAPAMWWSYQATGRAIDRHVTSTSAVKQLFDAPRGLASQAWGSQAHAAAELAMVASYLDAHPGATTYQAIDAVAWERDHSWQAPPWLRGAQSISRSLLRHQLDPLYLALGMTPGEPAQIDRWLAGRKAEIARGDAAPPPPLASGEIDRRQQAVELARASSGQRLSLDTVLSPDGLAATPKDRMALGWSGIHLLLICAGGVGAGVMLARRRYGEALCALAVVGGAALASTRSSDPLGNAPALAVCGVMLAGVAIPAGAPIRLRKPKKPQVDAAGEPLKAPTTFQSLGEVAPMNRPHPSMRVPTPASIQPTPDAPTRRPGPQTTSAPRPAPAASPAVRHEGASDRRPTASPVNKAAGDRPAREPLNENGPLGLLAAAVAPEPDSRASVRPGAGAAASAPAVSKLAEAAAGGVPNHAQNTASTDTPAQGVASLAAAVSETPASWPSWLRGKRRDGLGSPEGEAAGETKENPDRRPI